MYSFCTEYVLGYSSGLGARSIFPKYLPVARRGIRMVEYDHGQFPAFLHPAVIASCSEQNQRSPADSSITVLS